MLGLVVELGGHLGKKRGKKCAYAGKVLLQELLPGGGGLLDGTHSGIGCLLNGFNAGLRNGFATGGNVAIILYPFDECAACDLVSPCNVTNITGIHIFSHNEFFELVVIHSLLFLPYRFSHSMPILYSGGDINTIHSIIQMYDSIPTVVGVGCFFVINVAKVVIIAFSYFCGLLFLCV